MERIILESGKGVWFHAGEFSDSLAVSHLTGELPFYFEFFKKYPTSFLELRTKSVNTRELLKIKPQENIITSFSLSPEKSTKEFDLKTPGLRARLEAIGKLFNVGFPIGIHLDPVIYQDTFLDDYGLLVEQIGNRIPLDKIRYVSLGVVRFTKNVFNQVKKNYPSSSLLAEDFGISFDQKVRYKRPFRLYILNSIREILIQKGFPKEKIYLCMENF
jgi:spore photoproduct lyase